MPKNNRATRAIRKSGYTQRELASFLGYSEVYFSQKKNRLNGASFTESDITTLAHYGVAVSELLPETAQEGDSA